MEALNRDKRNERAMMWMAQLAPSRSERAEWLRKTLKVNPSNSSAKAALKKLRYKSASRENRTLLIWGAIVLVLIVFGVVVVLLVTNL